MKKYFLIDYRVVSQDKIILPACAILLVFCLGAGPVQGSGEAGTQDATTEVADMQASPTREAGEEDLARENQPEPGTSLEAGSAEHPVVEPEPVPESGAGDAHSAEDQNKPGEAIADTAPESPTTYVPKQDPVTTYLNAIDRTEAEFNAYSVELTDLYMGLGQALVQAREYEQARQAFQQGVQIERVNFGLDSPRQTNYLFAIADIDSILGNWRDADKVMQDIYSISAKTYGENDLDMLPVLNQMLSWYLSHRPVEAEANRFADLERSELLASKMASITASHKGLGHPETASLYRQIGQIQWYTLRYLLSQGVSVEPNLVLAMGSPSQNPNTRDISIKDHIESGRQAFARAAESVGNDENRSLIEQAEAVAQLGDWNLAFGKRKSAGESYHEAWLILAQGGKTEQEANAYFASPTPVRFMYGGLDPAPVDQTPPEGVVLDVSMTVTPGGRTLNIDILSAPENIDAEELRLIKRNLSGMKFRPRLEQGYPEKTENFVWQLPLTQLEWLK